MKLKKFTEGLEALGFDTICEHISKKGGIYLELGSFNVTITGDLFSENNFTIYLYTEDGSIDLEIKPTVNKLFKSHLDIVTAISMNMEL